MNVYSTRFMDRQGFTGTSEYEVAAGTLAILRDVDVYASVGLLDGPAHLRVWAPSGATIFLSQCDTDTSVNQQWRGRQVFSEGEVIRVNTDAAYDFVLSGYVLALP